ncbi:hypothetical protein HYZ97_00970 [Candidatus Pacearchaeota archaeon]|nr:hypothetical protein [Candidatus Pacearchaeota archaeon]
MVPLKGYVCPDGVKIKTEDCLTACRYSGGRCLSRSTLTIIAKGEREWTGNPSTTQLLNGTRLEYLRLTRDYYIDPKSMAYAFLGTKVHKELEIKGQDVDATLVERQLGDEITGTPDLYEVDEGWQCPSCGEIDV